MAFILDGYNATDTTISHGHESMHRPDDCQADLATDAPNRDHLGLDIPVVNELVLLLVYAETCFRTPNIFSVVKTIPDGYNAAKHNAPDARSGPAFAQQLTPLIDPT